MYQILFVLLIFFIVVLIYSAVVGRFIKSRFIFFLPSIIAVLIYGGTLYWHVTAPAEGFQRLTIYLTALFAVAVIGTNVISSIVFLEPEKNEKDK